MIDKRVASAEEALAGIVDGSTIMVSGFGESGSPNELLEVLARQGLRDLTIVANNAGTGRDGLAALLDAGCVRKVICSYPRAGRRHRRLLRADRRRDPARGGQGSEGARRADVRLRAADHRGRGAREGG